MMAFEPASHADGGTSDSANLAQFGQNDIAVTARNCCQVRNPSLLPAYFAEYERGVFPVCRNMWAAGYGTRKSGSEGLQVALQFKSP